MRRHRTAVLIDHDIRVAVVCGKKQLAAFCQDLVDDLTDAGVDRFDGRNRSLQHAGVPDHVAVGEVQDDQIINVLVDLLQQRIRDQIRAHLRLQVIGRHLRGGDQDAVFSRIGRFHTTVEEEGDVRIFLRFGDAQLSAA